MEEKKPGPAKYRTVLFSLLMLVTGVPHSAAWEQSIGVRPRQVGLLEPPSSIMPCCPRQVSAWEIPRSGSGLGRRCCKSPFPWQGMESRTAQQPALIIRLLLGLSSSCSCYGWVTAASAHAPTCAPSLAVPGCPKFISSHAFCRAASLWVPLGMSFRRAPVTSADTGFAHSHSRGATSRVPATPRCPPVAAPRWHPCLRGCCWQGKLAEIPV